MNAEQRAALVAEIRQKCAYLNAEDLFDSMLDECYSFESVGGPFASLTPSRVLKECDPVAYRCGVSDYMDANSDHWVEIDGDYYVVDDVASVIDEKVEALYAEREEVFADKMRRINQTGEDQPDADDRLAEIDEEIAELRDFTF